MTNTILSLVIPAVAFMGSQFNTVPVNNTQTVINNNNKVVLAVDYINKENNTMSSYDFSKNIMTSSVVAKTEKKEEKEVVELKPVMVKAIAATPTPVAQVVATPVNTSGPLTVDQITYLGNCEAGMDPTKNTGNGYYGAFQFSYGTWKSMGTAYERADLAPLDVQIDAVQRLLSRSSIFTQFPGCARKMQSLGLI